MFGLKQKARTREPQDWRLHSQWAFDQFKDDLLGLGMNELWVFRVWREEDREETHSVMSKPAA